MSDQIEVFDFRGQQVRAFTDRKGEPWFVAKDVCDILGIRTDTLRGLLDEDEVSSFNPNTIGVGNLDVIHIARTGGRAPLIISEPGLYGLVLKSRKPEAKDFKRWVKHQVLPSINHYGGYMLGQENMTPEQMALASMKWLQSRVDSQSRQLEAQKPKVIFADAVSVSQTNILVGDLAKILKSNGVDIGGTRLFQWMRDNGYLMKNGMAKNMPTQKSMQLGLFKVKETTVTHADGHTTISKTPKVTGKGQEYFINRFLDDQGELLK